jgi:hypothetical protein
MTRAQEEHNRQLRLVALRLVFHLAEYDRHDSRAFVTLLGELLDFINAPLASVGPLVDLAAIPARGGKL